ncbi:hypothetical protein MD588_11310 [Photobacterium sp. SDRW27]|uniref:hypothetical protein n=1 Tax=Photobacterium obscurum TaxID=2829490 RepID=UPI00224481E8|nr:hypothetical protein [Photobacterium obscurum]MCW8329396.1 hypothetical protein [Photobacterium obscurum]
MLKRQEFIDKHELLISKTYDETLHQVASILEQQGYINKEFRYSCVPGVVIEVKNRLSQLLEDNGWTVEINFNHSRPESELYIQVY